MYYDKIGNINNNQWKFMAVDLKDDYFFRTYGIEDNDVIMSNHISLLDI